MLKAVEPYSTSTSGPLSYCTQNSFMLNNNKTTTTHLLTTNDVMQSMASILETRLLLSDIIGGAILDDVIDSAMLNIGIGIAVFNGVIGGVTQGWS